MSERSISDDVIRASEIGEYVHCHRAWWLGHIEGVPNANRAQLEAGTERHRQHGQRVWRATVLRDAARVMILLAVVVAVLLGLRLAGLI